jgi:hypothetical protein
MARGFPYGRSHSRSSYRDDKQVPLMHTEEWRVRGMLWISKWTSAQRQVTKKLHNRKVRYRKVEDDG